ncbi:autotransporter domain-containing protein [Brucella pseudogrignonensis]|uniref:autotransporter domain-containing protein n=1 Tax=Brucella pseudogrignonensis TaxID=419475 RepID=UPI0028B7F0F1|nr:autotransporter domain-containing protein [Brucella pseudogrignonensis]MDT6942257.1 autotransporter domain-containing protein [Brucella pseudogrignonensis]
MFSFKNGLKFLLLSTALMTPNFALAQNSPQVSSNLADAEYYANWGLDMINALPAYQKGFTGKGISVAVVDTGFDVNHPEFFGRISPFLYNFGNDQAPDNIFPERKSDGSLNGHGVHVAGTIGAGRNGFGMQGVAYDAMIMPLRGVEVASRRNDVSATDEAIVYAADHGAQILNGSYGPNTYPNPVINKRPNPNYQVLDYQLILSEPGELEQTYEAMKYAAEKDVVMVFAAGNSRQDQPGYATSIPSGNGMVPLITPDFIRSGKIRFIDYDNPDLNIEDPSTYTFLDPTGPDFDDMDFSELKGSLIAVVSVGPDGKMAPYSNECGEAAEWCLAAPGGAMTKRGDPNGIYSTWPAGDPTNDYQEYQYLQGTSMASPHVAGAAAVVRSAFPYLNARQTIETILTTATKEGFEDEAKFGQGLLNLGAAVDGPMAFRYTGVFDVDTKGYSSIWSNSISGIGNLTKRGEGILVLDGNSSYQGGTNIVGGVLEVNGSITSPTDVSEAGTIAGLGSVGELTLLDGGRVAPGSAFNPENSIGTLTVNGTFTQQSGSTYLAGLVAGNGQDAGVDQIFVHGAADLEDGSSLELVHQGFSSGAQAYSRSVLLSATDGVSGTYGKIAGSYVQDARFIDFALDYDANNVFLDTSRSAVAFADVANSQNQFSTAVALESQGSGGALYDHILFLTQQDARLAYDQLSGEAYASIQSTLINNSAYTRSAVYNNLVQAFASSAATGQSPENGGAPTFWGHGFGGWTNLSGDGSAARSKSSIGGFISGIDAQFFDNWRLGVLASYSQTNFRLNERMSSGKSDDYTIGTYAGTQTPVAQGMVAFRSGLSYTWHNIEMNRGISFADFDDRLSADYNAGSFQVFGEMGYKLPLTEKASFEPYVNFAYVSLKTDSFSETSTQGAGLNVEENSMSTTLSTFGFRATATLNEKVIPVKARADIGWRYAFGDDKPTSAANFAGSDGFIVGGASIGKDTALVAGGFDFKLSEAALLNVSYQGQFGSGLTQNGVDANLRVRF